MELLESHEDVPSPISSKLIVLIVVTVVRLLVFKTTRELGGGRGE